MDSRAVKTKELTKMFGSIEIIKSCNMNIEERTVYGLIGQNGAGKTTLFKLLSGIVNPTSGKLKIFGMEMETRRKEILLNIGTLIDTPIFYEHLSAKDNLKLHLSYMNVSGYKVEEVLTMVGLEQCNKVAVSKFSLGMRQRLAIARSVCHKPRLLILDEPTNGLDPIGIKKMRELFQRLVRQENMTIVISSHILSELEQLADTIGFMENGKIIQEISSIELGKLNIRNLEEYFMKMSGGTNNV